MSALLAYALSCAYSPRDQREHVIDGSPCWCNPVTERLSAGDADDCGAVIIHTSAVDTPTQDRQYLHGAN